MRDNADNGVGGFLLTTAAEFGADDVAAAEDEGGSDPAGGHE